ncbi:hypothetical protein AVEN_231821-1 [Araneus ventricosus]|uniref:Secreted protein n=1 Tax=Araneus ventricosus TaxID=182803 RepID=A0A4Y2WFQ1_ARAVE|nr:hypothetical protein AVEN_231821-1 [Araneus ventricosus]
MSLLFLIHVLVVPPGVASRRRNGVPPGVAIPVNGITQPYTITTLCWRFIHAGGASRELRPVVGMGHLNSNTPSQHRWVSSPRASWCLQELSVLPSSEWGVTQLHTITTPLASHPRTGGSMSCVLSFEWGKS